MIIPDRKLNELFDWRLKISKAIDDEIDSEDPKQIIDLAGGYSLRGFNLCLKRPDVIYIDSDLPAVVKRKREILEEICEKEKITYPKNYLLIPIDVLGDNIWEKISQDISRDERTLIVAEGLTTYFSAQEFALFLKNEQSLLRSFSQAKFFSHEPISSPKGFWTWLLRGVFIKLLVQTKRRRNFDSVDVFIDYLKSLELRYEVGPVIGDSLFYSLLS